MAAPVLVLMVPAAPGGPATMTAHRLRARMSRLHPHIESAVAFADPDGHRPTPPTLKRSWDEVVLVPVELTHLHEPAEPVLRLAEQIRQGQRQLTVRIARPVGPAPALLNLVDARLRLAAHRAHCQEMDSLVLSAPDAGDQRGATMLSRLSRQWSQHHHLPVHLATNNHPSTSVGEVVAAQRREGRRHIAVGSLWVCEDAASRDHARRCLAAGAEVVAGPIGDDPMLAAWAFERYCSAAMGLTSEGPEPPVAAPAWR